MRILALDIGSSSVKAGLWTGRRFTARVRMPFASHFDGPRAEISPDVLLRALSRAATSVLAGASSIDAISYCAFSSGVIVTNRSGKPLTPIITHADRRSTAVALDLVKKHPQSWWLARTGNLPYPGGIGSSTLAWLAQEQPTLFRKPCRVGQLSSFIAAFLTGPMPHRWLIDPSQAAFLGLWDIRTREWNADVCRLIGIPVDALPTLHFADEILGVLDPAIARRWGISSGIPIVGGFVDTSAAVIQTPMHAGQLAHNTGSTDVLALCVNRPHPADGILTRPVGTGAHHSRHFPDRWLAVRTIASAGSALQWARDTLFPTLKDMAWHRLIARASRSNQNSPVRCSPTFAGQRAVIAQPRGAAFTGVTLSTSRDQLLQAILQGLVAESAHNYALLTSLHTPEKTVYQMGGATALARAMHAAWTGRHTFRPLPDDALPGLVLLAQKTLT